MACAVAPNDRELRTIAHASALLSRLNRLSATEESGFYNQDWIQKIILIPSRLNC